MKKLKILAAAAALSMCFSGCSKNTPAETVADEIQPKTTVELVQLYKENNADISSMSVSGTTKADISVKTPDETQYLPIELIYRVDMGGKDKVHISADIKMDMPDDSGTEDINMNMEAYALYDGSKADVWYKSSDSDAWYYETTEITEENAATIDREAVIDGDFSVGDTGYVVTKTFASIFESEEYKSLIADLTAVPDTGSDDDAVDPYMTAMPDINELLASIGTSFEDIQNQLSSAKIEWVFDKTSYKIIECNLKDFKYELQIPDTAFVSLSLSSANIISDYNSLDESSYTVPEDVKANAVSYADSFYDNYDIYAESGAFDTEPVFNESNS